MASDNLPSIADLRQFLTDTFNDEEITSLCFDYFPNVHDNFTLGMSKAQRIQSLIEYCQRRDVVPNLHAAIQRARPDQYQKRFPQGHDPKQVFVSHAHADAELAHRLAVDLQKHGWHVWIAPDSIRPGEKWVEAINRGLEGSGVFVLLLTPAAARSRWVIDETNIAVGLEHQGRLRFIPLEVASCDAPTFWNAYQRVSFGGRYEDGLAALFAELEQGQREHEIRVEEPRPQGLPYPAKSAPATAGVIWERLGRIPRLAWGGLLAALLAVGTYAIWPRGSGSQPSVTPATAVSSSSVTATLSPSVTTATASKTAPRGAPTETPRPGMDMFELNQDFDHAAVIGLSTHYPSLNFVPPPGETIDNDYFKLRTKRGMRVTCETLDLSPGTDTIMTLYDDNRDRLVESDDVDGTHGDFRSRAIVNIDFDGYLYVRVTQGIAVPDVLSGRYSYTVYCAPEPVPTPTSAPTTVAPLPTLPLVPTLTPTPKR